MAGYECKNCDDEGRAPTRCIGEKKCRCPHCGRKMRWDDDDLVWN